MNFTPKTLKTTDNCDVTAHALNLEHSKQKHCSGGSRISHWGAPTHWGGANLRHVHFLAKMYAKIKEIDPVGGACAMAPPGSANALVPCGFFRMEKCNNIRNYIVFHSLFI